MKKEIIINELEKSNEKSIYLFFNPSNGRIKELTPLRDIDSRVRVGEEYYIGKDRYILTDIFNYKKRKQISLKGQKREF